MRADKFLYHHARMGRRPARQAIEQGRLSVNGSVVEEANASIEKFDRVELDGVVLQSKQRQYLMLHKPKGIVCATEDKENTTVIDLLEVEGKEALHLAGRLDKNTSGLVLLTNDGKWSAHITLPSSKKPKVYLVESEKPLAEEMLAAFKKGILFEKEQVVTQPAGLEVLGEYSLRLTIYEGMHHQIKRMFLKFDNRVKELHRESVAGLQLDLAEGEYRALTDNEVQMMVG